jgi:hypothetical protein
MPFGLPRPSDITAQLNDKFTELIAKLDEILAELRKQNQGGTP